MYILTSRLIALNDSALPLPWYHRAPLGLMSGTPVYVALQAPKERPFGDLLVSVVDPAVWPYVSEINASKPDEPGVLADVYKHAPPLNIVIAEAVTVDSGSRHDARLILEPVHALPDQEIGPMVDRETQRLKESLHEMGFQDPQSDPIHPEHGELAWMDVGRIDFGWLRVEGWRKAVEMQACTSKNADRHDLSMAVVSADTNRRILRYVFPRKGAVTVSVTHADRPGSMGTIATALAGNDLNILSSLLRRGSDSNAKKAELVLVVEPTDEKSVEAEEVESRVRDALDALPPTMCVSPTVLGAAEPETVLYPRRRHEIAARPSKTLEPAIRSVLELLPDDKRPVFISRRFADTTDDYSNAVAKELRDVLDEHGLVALEGDSAPGTDQAVSFDVRAKMWASKAAIVLVASVPDESELSAFSVNLAHEWGFMQGQGKPLLPLVQKDLSGTISAIANLQGLHLATFGKSTATLRDQEDSIHHKVTSWLSQLSELSPDS